MDETERVANDRRIGCEILELLVSYYFLGGLGPNSADLIENMKAIKLVGLLIDDIILRLCKLGDRTKGTLSFRKLEKCCSGPVRDRAKDSRVRGRIDGFCSQVEKLASHRNSRIAHLSSACGFPVGSDVRLRLDPPVEMYEALRDAVQIWDDLQGAPQGYWLEHVDLRAGLLARNVDAGAHSDSARG